MASSGRQWRGRGGGRRRGGFRGGFRGGRSMRDRDMPPPPPAEDIDNSEVVCEGKKIIIELKKNEQGQFFKIIEIDSNEAHRGKVIFSVETGQKFRPILAELIEKYNEQGPPDENAPSDRIYSCDFQQGRRRFFADLRQNQRGYFMKLTQSSQHQKVFVAIPGESLSKFQESFETLLDSHPVPAANDTSPPMSPTGPPLPTSQELQAGGKRFFFDVERNDKGVYVRLTEIVRSGRKSHVNIPNSCWSKMADILMGFHQEMPSNESASGSGSEDN